MLLLSPAKTRALTDLLVAVFTRDELKAWLQLYYSDKLVVQIPWHGSRVTVVLGVVKTLTRHGRIDEELFANIALHRPHREDVPRVKNFVLEPDCAESQSDYLIRVSTTESERAAVFRIAEFAAYLFHLVLTGLVAYVHTLQLVDAEFLAGVACLSLAGGYWLSRYQLALHKRVTNYIREETGITPNVATALRPGDDLFDRDRHRYLEYIALAGFAMVASASIYEVALPCCERWVALVRCLLSVILLVLGLGIFRAARQPLVSYADHIADTRIKEATKRALRKVSVASSVTLLVAMSAHASHLVNFTDVDPIHIAHSSAHTSSPEGWAIQRAARITLHRPRAPDRCDSGCLEVMIAATCVIGQPQVTVQVIHGARLSRACLPSHQTDPLNGPPQAVEPVAPGVDKNFLKNL